MVAILHVVAMLKCYEKRFIQVLTCAFTGWNIEFVIISDLSRLHPNRGESEISVSILMGSLPLGWA